MSLIKKILKKNLHIITPGKYHSVEDWICIKRGLMIYFGNKINWSKNSYRVWRDYITDAKVKEDMLRESPEMQAFVQTYKK